MKFKKIILVVLIMVFVAGNVLALEKGVYGAFYKMKEYDRKNDVKIMHLGEIIFRNGNNYTFILDILNYQDKDLKSNFKCVMESKEGKEKYFIKDIKNLKLKPKKRTDIEVPIPQKIITQLKPKEYKLKVIMIEDGKEKVIGERGDITIEGSHIEKVYKSYSDIEFKDGVEYFEKEHVYYDDSDNYEMFTNEPTNHQYLPILKLKEIETGNTLIKSGKKCIIYKNKKTKYNLEFNIKLNESYTRTRPNSSKGEKYFNKPFYGDVVIGVSSRRNLSNLDYVIKKVKNIKINPGENKIINCSFNIKNLEKEYYRLIVIYKKKSKDFNKIFKNYIFGTGSKDYFIADQKVLKNYKIKLGYKLKNNNE